MMQDSAGAVIGALLGSWLLQYDFRLVCAAGAVLFILCALFNGLFLPARNCRRSKRRSGKGLAASCATGVLSPMC